MQLEGQVDYAATFVGGREKPEALISKDTGPNNIEETLAKISSKLIDLSHPGNHVNNINVYSHGCNNSGASCVTATQSTQTDSLLTTLCQNCEEITSENSTVESPMETSHGPDSFKSCVLPHANIEPEPKNDYETKMNLWNLTLFEISYHRLDKDRET